MSSKRNLGRLGLQWLTPNAYQHSPASTVRLGSRFFRTRNVPFQKPRGMTTTPSLKPGFWILTGTLGLCAAMFLSPPVRAEEDPSHADKRNTPSGLISFHEVKKHNTKDDCWVVIRDQAYDLTDFIRMHPGGTQIIIRNAGKDVTKIFEPIHPKGVIEAMLQPEQRLGRVDPATMPELETQLTDDDIRVLKAKKEKPHLSAMINLADIEDVARKVMTQQAWHYYRSDAEDGYSYRNNFAALRHYFFKPRILREVASVDTTTTILGMKTSLPIFVSPAAMAGLGHPEGEKNITRGSGKEGIIQGISSNSSCTLEEIAGARAAGQPLIFQLYLAKDREVSEAKLKEVEGLGFNAIMLTVDAPILGRREFDMRQKTVAQEDDDSQVGGVSATIDGYFDVNIGWKDVEWLQKRTKLPIIIKGIQSVEDCKLAIQYPGVKGILLSNHGGRQADYAPSSIDVLYELRTRHPETFDKVEIYVDGGFRRGTDVLKAICLGAKACGFGRSFLYANAAYGEAGVTKTIQILRAEITNAMQQIGVTSLAQCTPEMVKYMERAIDPPRPSDYSQV
ncbi:Cytochrome b2, mitochondrial precursor [Tulasnella sp. JGI-2019a]|nr:Cytochrome b2, mitochondrial precursor [Tulasnella sp. JGI-2019a]